MNGKKVQAMTILLLVGIIMLLLFGLSNKPSQLKCTVYGDYGDKGIKPSGWQCIPSDIVSHFDYPEGSCIIDMEACP